MGYLHINNLYKDRQVLLFKEVYCLEKIHGTSAHITYDGSKITFFAGGTPHEQFINLFDYGTLLTKFGETYIGSPITVYGEAYGGKTQGMSHTYGKQLKFIAFDVFIHEHWLDVEQAASLVQSLGLEFVHYVKIASDITLIDKEMERDSVQGIRNGVGEGHPSEGIVIRPPIEVKTNNGSRIIVKHKKAKFCETTSVKQVIDPAKLEVLKQADEIAHQWVTLMRLQHVADKLQKEIAVENISAFIPAMLEDIKREGEGEIIWSKDAEKAIGRQTALTIKQNLNEKLHETHK